MTESHEKTPIQREDIVGYLASADAKKLDWLLVDLTVALRIKWQMNNLTAGEWASAKNNRLAVSTIISLTVVLESIPRDRGFQGKSIAGNAPTLLASMIGFPRHRNQSNPRR